MTLRFFKAAGTLAVALVVLAGCDSATDSAGFVPTAEKSLLDFYVTGANPAHQSQCETYYAYESNSTIPVAISSWSVSGNGVLSSTSSSSASVLPTLPSGTATGSFVISATRAGTSSTFNLTVSVDGLGYRLPCTEI